LLRDGKNFEAERVFVYAGGGVGGGFLFIGVGILEDKGRQLSKMILSQ